jgi:AcrR family transcriptional regulator
MAEKELLLKQKRARSAARTKLEIMKAARARFSAENYERVGLRDIAADAGVDATLIARYFGSKEQLLRNVMTEFINDTPLTEGDRSTFGERFVTAFIKPGEHRLEHEFYLLLLRVLMIPDLQPLVADVMQDKLISPFERWLGGDSAQLRSKLIYALFTGTLMQSILPDSLAISEVDEQRYVRFLGRIVQMLVDDPDAVGPMPAGEPVSGR